MKKLIILFTLCIGLNALAQEKTKVTVSFEGFGNNPDLSLRIGNESIQTEAKGDLLYKGELAINAPTRGIVIDRKKSRYTSFWLEPGHGEVAIFKNDFITGTTVTGSKSHGVHIGIRKAKNLEEKRKVVYENINNPATRYYLNNSFQFSKFTDADLKKMYASIAPEYMPEMEKLRAYVETRDIPTVKRGTQLYDFTAQNADGDSFNTEDFRSKYLLLDFAATYCGPCWLGYPGMIEEVSKYENLAVLTLNEDHEIDSWKGLAKKNDLDIPWPVLWEGKKKKEVLEIYNINGWPTFFLISPKGKVLEKWSGASDARLRAALKEHVK